MTSKSSENKTFFKLLFTLAIPIISTDILNAFVNWVDTVMIGAGLGINEITAVGIANQIFFLYLFIIFGVCSGSAIFFGQFWGNGDHNGVRKVMGICFAMSSAFALLFLAGVYFYPKELLRIFSSDSEVIEIATRYIKAVGITYLIIAFTATINFALRFTGYVKVCLITTGIAILCNVTLNYLFIFVQQMGVEGAALGTVIARSLELLLLIIISYAIKAPIAGKLKSYYSASFKFFMEYFKVTSFVILNEIIWATGISGYMALYQNTGTFGQGAFQIANTAQQLFQTFGIGVGTACGVMISNALGAKQPGTAIKYAKKCMVFAPCLTAVMSTILVFAAPHIANLYKVEEIVKQHAVFTMYIIAAGMIIKVINYACIVSILRNGGDSLFGFVVDAISVWLVGIPMVYLATCVFKMPIYLAVAFAFSEEAVKLLACLARVKTNRWANCLVDKI